LTAYPNKMNPQITDLINRYHKRITQIHINPNPYYKGNLEKEKMDIVNKVKELQKIKQPN